MTGNLTLTKWDPQILIIKEGYWHNEVLNGNGHEEGASRRSDWDGKDILLRKVSGTPVERYREFERITSDELSYVPQAVLMYDEMLKEKEALLGVDGSAPLLFESVEARRQKAIGKG